MNQTATTTIPQATMMDLMEAVSFAKRAYYQQQGPLSAVETAAAAYRNAIIAKKEGDPKKFRKLRVPSVMDIIRGA